MEKKHTIITQLSVLMATFFVTSVAGFVYGTTNTTANEKSQPIIAVEARRDYDNRHISKEVAQKKIENRLDDLASSGDIQGWDTRLHRTNTPSP